MTVRIARTIVERLTALVAAAPDVEICGLLFGPHDRIEGFVPAANVAPDTATTFEIDPAALIGAYRAERAGGPRIAGHYHSHPGGAPVPSARDAAAAASDGRLWLIVSGGALRAWRFRLAGFVEVPLAIEG